MKGNLDTGVIEKYVRIISCEKLKAAIQKYRNVINKSYAEKWFWFSLYDDDDRYSLYETGTTITKLALGKKKHVRPTLNWLLRCTLKMNGATWLSLISNVLHLPLAKHQSKSYCVSICLHLSHTLYFSLCCLFKRYITFIWNGSWYWYIK